MQALLLQIAGSLFLTGIFPLVCGESGEGDGLLLLVDCLLGEAHKLDLEVL